MKELKLVANIGIERNTDRESNTHPAFILSGIIYTITEKIDIDLGIKGGLNKSHIFYVEPTPYWEQAEEKFIVHFTKVIVSAMGKEDGLEKEIGLKTEIVPLTRPFGLWAGSAFQGIVKVNGNAVPYSEVEIEYYNPDSKIKAPDEPYITQVIKADSNGVFTYAMPKAGWWGFSAINTADYTLKRDGKEYTAEICAVLWVMTREMR
jgi:cobalt/nickel transport protein